MRLSSKYEKRTGKLIRKNPKIKTVSWVYFDDEPRVQVKQQLEDQYSFIPISVAYLKYPSNN